MIALTMRGAGAAEARRDNGQEQLFDATKMGALELANRLVMAPLTRGRAGQQRTANALMTEYYEQRATAGLIISEATAISAQGYGWAGTPGIYRCSVMVQSRLQFPACHPCKNRNCVSHPG
jgi:2,4-dienoyl-CoA reductase-like NADH-dependent reductase (Old Yellow Enzyme family)